MTPPNWASTPEPAIDALRTNPLGLPVTIAYASTEPRRAPMSADSPLSWIECQKYPRTASSVKIFRLAKSKVPSWKIAPQTTIPVGSRRKTPT